MAGNLAVFYALVKGSRMFAGDRTDVSQAVPAGAGLALTAVLNARLSADAKSRIGESEERLSARRTSMLRRYPTIRRRRDGPDGPRPEPKH
jgi:hypothetical protein